ncbi:FYVE-containing protein_ putative, partial [Caligus rogercresseyi]
PSRLAAKKASEAVAASIAAAPSTATTGKPKKLYRIKYDKYISMRPSTGSPFDALIAATQVVNAVELSEKLPFSWKWSDEARDDLETHPKNCVVCQRTSRGVPALSCDYCSSVYHLDCLDPPLCEIPKDTWMCPTHVEHFVDSHLLDSTSFTQRIKLWDKYARAPVDTDSIRVDFFRKINSGKRGSSRLIRSRPRVPMSNRVHVPDLVKAQYRSPGPGFPREAWASVPSVRRQEDSNEWLKGVIALQNSFMRPKEDVKDEGNESDETASNCSLEVNDEDADLLTDEVRAALNELISRRRSKLANLPQSSKSSSPFKRPRSSLRTFL